MIENNKFILYILMHKKFNELLIFKHEINQRTRILKFLLKKKKLFSLRIKK